MTETEDTVRVLGIVGSPRTGGNTDTLVDEVLRGAKSAGAKIEKVILAELDIAPCQGCDACKQLGICSQPDDMLGLLENMERSGVWVLGTPVYWWGPSAQFKTYLDRWYGAGKMVEFEGRRVIVLMPLGDDDERTARHAVGMLKDAFSYTKMELLEVLVAPGVHKPGEVAEHQDIMARAYAAGKNAVSKGRG
jgi:multimeric flavodoxin WrbA